MIIKEMLISCIQPSGTGTTLDINHVYSTNMLLRLFGLELINIT
jgi:hypothetical protein